jgi:hypothetical protein
LKVRTKFLGMPESLSIFENGKEFQVDFTGDTLKDFFNYILSKTGHGKKNILFDDQGEISLDILTLINGRHTGFTNREKQRLHEDDLIEIWYERG